MRFSWTRIGAVAILAFLAAGGTGCTLVNKVRAKDELNASARAYKEGHFDEAEAHAKRALYLEPTNRTAMIFLARVIHQQYRPGVDQPDNVQRARDAIQAYQTILANDPKNEEAYKAISVLYAAIHDDAKLRDWIMRRANDSSMSNEKRAEAYAILAGKDWDCSFKITELSDVKVPNQGSPGFTYKKPKEQKDFDKIQRCVVSGLEEAETAIKYDPNNDSAWSYKQNLLLEDAKIAFMNGEMDKKANYEKLAEAAGKRAAALFDERSKREAAAAVQSPSPK
jgi:hypothetical protein